MVIHIMSWNVMQNDCFAIFIVQGQGHSEGSYNHNMTVASAIPSELLILLQPHFFKWWFKVTNNIHRPLLPSVSIMTQGFFNNGLKSLGCVGFGAQGHEEGLNP